MRLVLLGDPVAHSRSPSIHNAALAHLGVDGSYAARRVDAAGVEAAFAELRSGGLDGANVTMPHKPLAAALADELSPDAARAGAVNTLLRAGDAIAGFLTDVDGVRAAWVEAELPADGPVLVLGSGGAAAAALLALEGRELYVAARRPAAVDALLARVGVAAVQQAWGAGHNDATVVNATPIGMRGEHLPVAVTDAAAGIFDMAYGPEPTPAVAGARRTGLPAADGLDMLVMQAAASLTIWTGRAAPLPVMRAAAR